MTPYAARVQSAPDPVELSRRPPRPAIAAALLAAPSAFVAFAFGAIALAFSGGQTAGGAWLLIAVPFLLFAGLVVGAVLLLLGRSWLAVVVPAGVMTALVLTGYVQGGWAGGFFGVLALVAPPLTAVLAALPGVRRWVAGRRATRRAARGRS